MNTGHPTIWMIIRWQLNLPRRRAGIANTVAGTVVTRITVVVRGTGWRTGVADTVGGAVVTRIAVAVRDTWRRAGIADAVGGTVVARIAVIVGDTGGRTRVADAIGGAVVAVIAVDVVPAPGGADALTKAAAVGKVIIPVGSMSLNSTLSK